MTHYSSDGKTAYQIMRDYADCPRRTLPAARTMTQARTDYESIQDLVIEWYEKEKLTNSQNQPVNV